MRLALWIALIVPVAAMVMGLKTKKYAWNCALSVSCAAIVLLTGRGMAVAPLAAGLLVSVAGDYFMSHKAGREKWYIAGIALFFVAHVCFAVYSAARFAGSVRLYLAAAALVVMLGLYLHKRVLPKVGSGAMKGAVVAYSLISALSLVLAAGQVCPEFERLLYSCGILLIVISDAMIAETDFVGNGECAAYIMPTYYLCHILAAASAVVGMVA